MEPGSANRVDPPRAPELPRLGPAPGAIGPDDAFALAGRKAMWVHVDRLIRFEEAVREPARKDELKRYRVATRRLRAAMRLFADAYPDRQVRPLRDALGDLGRAAGAARDVDVRLADLARWAAEQDAPTATAVEPLARAWREERAQAAADFVRRLDTKRHQRLLRDVIAFVNGDARPSPAGSRSVRDSVASRLWKSFEALRERGGLVRWADLPTVHEVRIDAKRMRYGLEFLADVLPPSVTLLVERLVALQDHLGALNDAAIIAAAARAYLSDRRTVLQPDERAAIARYAADRDGDVARLRRGIGRPWRPIASSVFARRLGRTVVIA